MTAVVVKDKMEEWLEPVDADTPHSQVTTHNVKSSAAFSLSPSTPPLKPPIA
jgi:hypothetical protein